jgi:hypothetical protein
LLASFLGLAYATAMTADVDSVGSAAGLGILIRIVQAS